MKMIVDKNQCSGCHACYSICPQNCIAMIFDEEGFKYPQINIESCVDCGMCQKVCPSWNEYKPFMKGKAYACINKDDIVRENSSSGGIFSLIAEYVIEKCGIVFGAGYDEELNVCHQKIVDKKELHKLRGSKYVQSDIGNTYKQVKELLEENKLVLFTGTPCQISGLKNFLQKEYDNLILQDIICHGVPSVLVWNKYLDYQKEKNGSNIRNNTGPDFRNKVVGWKNFSMYISFENGSDYYKEFTEDLYLKSFINNICLRPSCYDCHSKSVERESDITLADFWGVWDVLPEMYDDKGTSLVLVNSKKGKEIFENISELMKYKEVDFDKATSYNSAAFKSVAKNKSRDKFMRLINKEDFEVAVLKSTRIQRNINNIKRIIKNIKK